MENSSPLVSVIVPLFNREKFLPQLFKNLKEQTYCNFELILIDDGSVDNTQTWLAANKHILSQNIICAKQENALLREKSWFILSHRRIYRFSG
jgi:glycosyltransferase involved in cell wall biosynthesis